MYEIESGVPAPAHACGRPPKYQFAKMGVGDSFKAPRADAKKVQSAARAYGRRHGVKFASQIDGEIVRVWRIA